MYLCVMTIIEHLQLSRSKINNSFKVRANFFVLTCTIFMIER